MNRDNGKGKDRKTESAWCNPSTLRYAERTSPYSHLFRGWRSTREGERSLSTTDVIWPPPAPYYTTLRHIYIYIYVQQRGCGSEGRCFSQERHLFHYRPVTQHPLKKKEKKTKIYNILLNSVSLFFQYLISNIC